MKTRKNNQTQNNSNFKQSLDVTKRNLSIQKIATKTSRNITGMENYKKLEEDKPIKNIDYYSSKRKRSR